MKNKKGFTLIELMASLLILATVLAITIPNFIKNNKNSETVNFNEQLKHLNNQIQMLSEVQTENYKHYPHPLLIDYDKVKTDIANGIKSEQGIPYIAGVNKNSNDYYLSIKLNANSSGDAIVDRIFNGSSIENTILPNHLKEVLQEKYGRNAQLKAFPLDIETLNRYSYNPFSLTFPKTVINGYSDNKLQNKSVWTTPLKDLFLNSAIVPNGTSSDAKDRIPNDGLIEKPGYYVLIVSDETSLVLYTGTDAIYQNRYINMGGFDTATTPKNKGSYRNFVDNSFSGNYKGSGGGNFAEGGSITNGNYYWAKARYIDMGTYISTSSFKSMIINATTGGNDSTMRAITFSVSKNGTTWYTIGSANGSALTQTNFTINNTNIPISSFRYIKGENSFCIDLLNVEIK